MSKNAAALLVILVVAFSIVLLAAFGRGSGIDPGSFDKGQRFTAKPGTTRENAVILTSDKRAASDDPSAGIARPADAVEDSDPLEVMSLSNSNSGPRTGPASERAQAALNSFSPESGLQMIGEALALTHDREQIALLHEAEGQLLARTDPPDYDRSRAAFDRAVEMADDAALREAIVYSSVQTMIGGGLDEEAKCVLETQLAADPPARETGFKLQLLHGQIHERAGEYEAAEKTYKTVLNAMADRPTSLDADDAMNLVRLAGLRLTALYRDHDRGQAADALSRDVKARLAKMRRNQDPAAE